MRAHPAWRCIFMALILFVAAAAPAAKAPRELTIYAATSLTDAFMGLADAFMTEQPNVNVLLNFASSSRLAAQLLNGAPADIFASANHAQMEIVAEDGRVYPDDISDFASNRLILIAPADNPASIDSVADLARPDLLLVLAVSGTPIRDYTDAMLLSHNADHGADFASNALANLVSEESNVRQVVTRVSLGEADAGIVYRSDAMGDVADSLTIIPIAPRHNQIASYPLAPLADADESALAETFVAFVLSEAGQGILREFGFCPPLTQPEPLALTPTPTATKTPDTADECDAPDTGP